MFRNITLRLLMLIVLVILGINSLYLYNVKIIESLVAKKSSPENTKFVSLGGETIAYQEVNNEAPTTVLFVGGLSAWNETWSRVINALGTHGLAFNYVAIDLPPFGYSSVADNASYFRDFQANRIAKFIQAKKIDKIIIVAHSYGAGPATEYALLHRDRVLKLVVIDGVLNVDEQKVVENNALMDSDYMRDMLIGIFIHIDKFALSQLKHFVYITDNIDYPMLHMYTHSFNTVGTTHRLSSWLRDYVKDPMVYQSTDSRNYQNIVFPVRLIWGKKDTITPLSDTKVLLDHIPDVNLIALDDVGHIPMIENYEKFDSALLQALTQ